MFARDTIRETITRVTLRATIRDLSGFGIGLGTLGFGVFRVWGWGLGFFRIVRGWLLGLSGL